jgi:hypothetical protein
VLEHPLDVAGFDAFFVTNQPREHARNVSLAAIAGQRRAESLEQSVHERAGEASAARVDLIAAPPLDRGCVGSRDGDSGQLERIDEWSEVVGRRSS